MKVKDCFLHSLITHQTNIKLLRCLMFPLSWAKKLHLNTLQELPRKEITPNNCGHNLSLHSNREAGRLRTAGFTDTILINIAQYTQESVWSKVANGTCEEPESTNTPKPTRWVKSLTPAATGSTFLFTFLLLCTDLLSCATNQSDSCHWQADSSCTISQKAAARLKRVNTCDN